MLIFLLVFSTLIRALIAGLFELGNDEVYYWTYAVYPDLSHFDHPPMIGWLIRIFTFNLQFQQEFFLRLASVIGGSLNTWIIYLVGKKLKDELTGWYAALLYTASIYGFVITGIFILPDTPQTFFWLLALLLMLEVLPGPDSTSRSQNKMLRISILLGLGLLSKYTTVFLWLGMILFVLSNNRNWLKKWSFYTAHLVMAGFFSIVIIWNVMNQFISFAYQGGRTGIAGSAFNTDTFLTEIAGEILYNNPVNFILLILALIAVFKTRSLHGNPKIKILLYSGLPLIIVFLLLSLFRGTLPHWSGPGYMTLIPITALWIREMQTGQAKAFPWSIKIALAVLTLVIGLSIFQVATGFIQLWPSDKKEGRMGKRDYSLEIYGWKQLGDRFKALSDASEKAGEIQAGSPIVSYRWFPAANLEYYVARPSNRDVMAFGNLEAIHKYAWINRLHGGFHLNSDAWYITSSRDFKDPKLLIGIYYSTVLAPDTITITRMGKPAYYFYVYRLKNLQAKPANPLLIN